MTEQDFKECWFINAEMKFYTYKDFVSNCYALKRLYENNLGKNGKIFYKWFIYSNIHMTQNQKNKIWDWINNYCDTKELYLLLK